MKKVTFQLIITAIISAGLYAWLFENWKTLICNGSENIAYPTFIALCFLIFLIVHFLSKYKINVERRQTQPLKEGDGDESIIKYQIPHNESGLGEIALYYDEREKADPDVTNFLTNKEKMVSPKNIFIAAIGFNTIRKILTEANVINSIAKAIIDNPNDFNMTIVFPKEINDMKIIRPERVEQAQESVISGHKELFNFSEMLATACLHYLTNDKIRRNSFNIEDFLKFRTYGTKIMPRHFIMKGDDTIFVGSYLSHKVGSNSYLLQLKKCNKPDPDRYHLGLFKLFDDEIDSLIEEKNSNKITISELKEIIEKEKILTNGTA